MKWTLNETYTARSRALPSWGWSHAFYHRPRMPGAPLLCTRPWSEHVVVASWLGASSQLAVFVCGPPARRHRGARRCRNRLSSPPRPVSYLLTLRFVSEPGDPVNRLLAGAAGAGKLIITGAQSWGLRSRGAEHRQALAWMGTAMYAAFASRPVARLYTATALPRCARNDAAPCPLLLVRPSGASTEAGSARVHQIDRCRVGPGWAWR